MNNLYFPNEEITFNDLFFVCYIIERTSRHIKRQNNYVVEKMGADGIKRQLSIAETNHCLNPLEVVDAWVEEYGLEVGDVDVTQVDPSFTDKVPTELQMGKVYARLIDSITDDEDCIKSIQAVYASPICNTIDNYNSSAYYEPSYVITRAFYNGSF